jgi:hypothetical protein
MCGSGGLTAGGELGLNPPCDVVSETVQLVQVSHVEVQQPNCDQWVLRTLQQLYSTGSISCGLSGMWQFRN